LVAHLLLDLDRNFSWRAQSTQYVFYINLE
jgi:hypothetical protein